MKHCFKKKPREIEIESFSPLIFIQTDELLKARKYGKHLSTPFFMPNHRQWAEKGDDPAEKN